jgi:hypothetical protein
VNQLQCVMLWAAYPASPASVCKKPTLIIKQPSTRIVRIEQENINIAYLIWDPI